jgi:hypothetical protein
MQVAFNSIAKSLLIDAITVSSSMKHSAQLHVHACNGEFFSYTWRGVCEYILLLMLLTSLSYMPVSLPCKLLWMFLNSSVHVGHLHAAAIVSLSDFCELHSILFLNYYKLALSGTLRS